MSEQLYRIESIENHDLSKTPTVDLNGYCMGALVPVPEVRDIRWAWERMKSGREMLANDIRCRVFFGQLEVWDNIIEVWRGCSLNQYWLNEIDWSEPSPSPQTGPKCDWCGKDIGMLTYCSDACREGHYREACDMVGVPQPPSPQPGSLEWAKAHVAIGGAVWFGVWPLVRYAAGGTTLPDGTVQRNDIGADAGWHPWGDRAWLAALPDGTRVCNPRCLTDCEVTKRGAKLVSVDADGDELEFDIAHLTPATGWDMARDKAEQPWPASDWGRLAEPQHYTPSDESVKAMADKSQEWLADMAEAEDKCESVSAGKPADDPVAAIRDDLADLRARVARLEDNK